MTNKEIREKHQNHSIHKARWILMEPEVNAIQQSTRKDERDAVAERLEMYLNCDYSNTNGLFSLRKDLNNLVAELRKDNKESK